MDKSSTRHWLDRYGKGYHAWVRKGDEFIRPCGLCEFKFDCDGRYFGGRADVNGLLKLNVSTRLSGEQLRHHVVLAFTLLRLRHCLLAARTELRTLEVEPWFLVGIPRTSDAAIRDAGSALQFLDPAVDGVSDMDDFYVHAQNVARIVKPSEAMARVFVLPRKGEGNIQALQFLFVMAHQITDGLSSMNWMADFVRILNMPTEELRREIEMAISPESIRAKLPPAQEDLYAPVAATTARERWFWAITLILRHVEKPMPAAFPNPLHRDTRLSKPRPFALKYPNALDYSQTPPLNTFYVRLQLSPAASKRLYRLCKEAKASIGAGGFVLVGMAMMAIHEERFPNKPDAARRPFVGSFPLNPRVFFGAKNILESVMLAFSKGIVLPFLPSHLDVEGRFRLLVRQASRQLSAYQKRVKLHNDNEAVSYMGIKGPGRLLATNYIDGIERLRDTLPPRLKDALPPPQGEYVVPSWAVSRATCGVSSIGAIDWSASKHDLGADPGEENVVASIERFTSGVRVRETEFLVGTWSEDGIIGAGVSFDGNFIDEDSVQLWVEKMKSILDVSDDTSSLRSRL
ncbi:hypothetical protein F5B22DRAFT_115821 [Xylaria bambusicola]|uniref:uncharacterized protein n=1 Tax=Xylaria bambusicola TaxID=326684 RepID=UPI002008D5CE|nr:uncharacterized protein F5B22DRAFT_115821 [Xylaria bambusicola]KAI0517275.1 hypothetical protein F5B22DRAFT_115821 [Xylaria bambusicola]